MSLLEMLSDNMLPLSCYKNSRTYRTSTVAPNSPDLNPKRVGVLQENMYEIPINDLDELK